VDGGLAPTIVAGDFNAPPEGRNFRDHWGDLRNAFGVAGVGFGATRLNGWIRLRIDHVLYGTGFRAVRAWVGNAAGSDHLPLIVDLVRLERATDR
jgi:endonuclease/exonuclease/phosphatase (EEP) superfamily protein YafD